MTLKQFYQENYWEIVCIGWAIIFVLGFAAHLAWKQLRSVKKPKDDDDSDWENFFSIKPTPPTPVSQQNITHDDNHFILKMYKEKWALLESIFNATTQKQLDELYLNIEAFYQYHDLLVDHTTVFTHTQKIYEAHARKALELSKDASLHKASS
jgi:hypothetical protein